MTDREGTFKKYSKSGLLIINKWLTVEEILVPEPN